MLNFASQELNDREDSNNYYEFLPVASEQKSEIKSEAVKLFADKIRVPTFSAPIARPRLFEHLKNSLKQFSVTLITGRTGMGKTILAADFAGQSHRRVAWYKAETADGDWKIFSSYLLGSLSRCCPDFDLQNFESDKSTVAATTESLAAQFNCAAGDEPFLIVLDDLHSVFDAAWFNEFFDSFVPLLAPNIHLLMIARTLPPLQIWRLRSKQILGVIDEKLLTFNLEETQEFFRSHRLSPTAARSAFKRTYGRIAKLEKIAEKKTFT